MPVPVEPAMMEAFRIDPESGAPVIEIVVEHYDDLFNRLDRAPFRRRDLSPDFKQYLQECSLWVPLAHPLAFEIQLTLDRHDEAREHEVVAGIRAYFAWLIYVHRTETRRQRGRIASFVGLSFVLLTAALLLGGQVDKERVLQAFLLNGFTVGGWVFLWEALSIAFIRRLDQHVLLARHRRLVDASFRFVAQSPDPLPQDLGATSSVAGHPLQGDA
jgi:hypothetical protein